MYLSRYDHSQKKSYIKSEFIGEDEFDDDDDDKELASDCEKKNAPETYLIDRYKYAVRHIRQGLSVEEACNKYRISKGALLKCLSGGKAPRGKKTRLNEAEENEIVSWLINDDTLRYNDAIHMVFELVNNIFHRSQRPNPFSNGRPSMDWWYDFLSRHPQIMASKPEWLKRGKVNDQYIEDVQSGKLRCTKFRRALLSAIQYMRSINDQSTVMNDSLTSSSSKRHSSSTSITSAAAKSSKGFLKDFDLFNDINDQINERERLTKLSNNCNTLTRSLSLFNSKKIAEDAASAVAASAACLNSHTKRRQRQTRKHNFHTTQVKNSMSLYKNNLKASQQKSMYLMSHHHQKEANNEKATDQDFYDENTGYFDYEDDDDNNDQDENDDNEMISSDEQSDKSKMRQKKLASILSSFESGRLNYVNDVNAIIMEQSVGMQASLAEFARRMISQANNYMIDNNKLTQIISLLISMN